MAYLHDLIYRAERIGHIDITRLALLFTLMNLRSMHPTVHEALAPSLMDGTITLGALKNRLHFFYKMQSTQSPDPSQLAFPAFPTTYMSPFTPYLPSPLSLNVAHTMPPAPMAYNPYMPPTLAMPANIPPRATICPNCKKLGHTVEFCISPGGRMAGQSAFDAIARQCTACEAMRMRPCEPLSNVTTTNNTSNTLLKVGDNGTIWIGGIRYKPEPEPVKAAITDINNMMTATDQGEYANWILDGNLQPWDANASAGDLWVDTANILLASAEISLFANNPIDLLLYLDSGASTHISCVESDFSALTPISPHQIMGVGNSLVSATGIGTDNILLPGTDA